MKIADIPCLYYTLHFQYLLKIVFNQAILSIKFISPMSSRIRSPRQRKMAISHSQPSTVKNKHIPLALPTIKSRKPTFYDQIIVSPDFVDISTSRKSETPKYPQMGGLSASRSRIFLNPTSPDKHFLQKLAEQDRVVQRYEQNQAKYKQLVTRIKEKSLSRQRQQQKNNLSLIYQRLMGIM